MGRAPVPAGDDFLIDLHLVLGVEGRMAGGHLVQEHPERPPVHGAAVALGEDDLGREVLGCAAQRPRATLDHFAEAQVCHLHVAGRVDQNVFRFQVSVH